MWPTPAAPPALAAGAASAAAARAAARAAADRRGRPLPHPSRSLPPRRRLEGKVAVVTASTAGIGLGIARRLAAEVRAVCGHRRAAGPLGSLPTLLLLRCSPRLHAPSPPGRERGGVVPQAAVGGRDSGGAARRGPASVGHRLPRGRPGSAAGGGHRRANADLPAGCAPRLPCRVRPPAAALPRLRPPPACSTWCDLRSTPTAQLTSSSPMRRSTPRPGPSSTWRHARSWAVASCMPAALHAVP